MTTLKIKKDQPLSQKTPCLVVGIVEGRYKTALLEDLDRAFDGAVTRAVREKEFTGSHKQTLLLHPGKRLAAHRLLLVGPGAGLQVLDAGCGPGLYLRELAEFVAIPSVSRDA